MRLVLKKLCERKNSLSPTLTNLRAKLMHATYSKQLWVLQRLHCMLFQRYMCTFLELIKPREIISPKKTPLPVRYAPNRHHRWSGDVDIRLWSSLGHCLTLTSRIVQAGTRLELLAAPGLAQLPGYFHGRERHRSLPKPQQGYWPRVLGPEETRGTQPCCVQLIS